ncbi:uncharacterized protein LOC144437710 [Glandiceps talaboti]
MAGIEPDESIVTMRERRQVAYDQAVRELEDIIEALNNLLRVHGSKAQVLEHHKQFLRLYDQYLTAENDLYYCLSEHDQGFYSLMFASRRSYVREMQTSVENYFGHCIDPEDSASQTSGKTSKSKSSRGSRYSTTSLLRLQEEQKQAEINVRKSALEEKLRLDIQGKRLEMELEMSRLQLGKLEEEFRLKQEMAVSNARTQVLERFEENVNGSCLDTQITRPESIKHRVDVEPKSSGIKLLPESRRQPVDTTAEVRDYVYSLPEPSQPRTKTRSPQMETLQQPEGVQSHLVSGFSRYSRPDEHSNYTIRVPETIPMSIDRPVGNGTVQRPEVPVSTQPVSSVVQHAGTQNIGEMTARCITKELRKPQVELSKFGGNPMDFPRFLRQFTTRIVAYTDSDDERMSYLEQYTTGEAHKIILGYSHLNSDIGYSKAMEELKTRYGDPEVVAAAYIKKALNWPAIKSDDAKALDDYAVFLMECQYAVGTVDAGKVLEYADNIRQIVKKLPFWLHDKWRNIVQNNRDQDEAVQFKHLVDLVRREARKATDPMYGRDMLVSETKRVFNTSGRQFRGKQAGGKVLATNVESCNASSLYKDGKQTSAGTDQNKTSKKFAFDKPCGYCSDSGHVLNSCLNFVSKPARYRSDFVKSKGLCYGCLKQGHLIRQCRARLSCDRCNEKHPTILHDEDRAHKSSVEISDTAKSQQGVSINSNTCMDRTVLDKAQCSMGAGDSGECTMAIVPVVVRARNNIAVETYAFLDTGSNVSFCTEGLAKQLGVTGRKMTVKLDTMGSPQCLTTHQINELMVSDLDGHDCVSLPPLYTKERIPVTSKHIPTQKDIERWDHLKGIAVPTLNADIGLLIGNNVPDAYTPKIIKTGPRGSPYAAKTAIGWILWNVIRDKEDLHSNLAVNRVDVTVLEESRQLEQLVRNAINLDFPERCVDTRKEPSREDQLFKEKMTKSIRFQGGHYSMDLPFRDESVLLPDNRDLALNRLHSLRRRMVKDYKFFTDYRDFMNKLLVSGYATKVSEDGVQEDTSQSGKVWYIPHHGVYHPRKPQKIRVVFDCSAKCKGVSLNDTLLSGPNLTNTIVNVLLRFRQGPVAIMADIESMFHQVKVSDHHTDCLRFLWWPDGDFTREPDEYKMVAHLFGAVSSPACANIALHQTAIDNKQDFNSEVVDGIFRNFYVDDFLKSIDTDEQGIVIAKDTRELCQKGGFRLTKWISTSKAVNNSIPVEERAKTLLYDLDQHDQQIERALGVVWSVDTDTFGFKINLKDGPYTRRGILSKISTIFDPLGIAAPFVLPARILLQSLCKQNIGWDEPIGGDDLKKWRQWVEDIPYIEQLTVPRSLQPRGVQITSCQLHMFSDASDKGYGIAAFTRLSDNRGQVHCNLLMGKARVAPLKRITIPRMELTAASISVKFAHMITKEMDYQFDKIIYWTDSMSVLRYINNNTSRFHTFVANRLTTIHEGSSPEQWRYVNTKLNVADIASRGLQVKDEKMTKQWLYGPAFLKMDESQWPKTELCRNLPADDPEVKGVAASTMKEESHTTMDKLLSRYSSWERLKTTVAWILRLKENLKKRMNRAERVTHNDSQKPDYLTAADMRAAEMSIVKYVQERHFSDISKDCEHRFMKLDPVKDSNGVVRVGGRLSRAAIPMETKHPILLPEDSPITELILEDIHRHTGHMGSNITLTKLRERYWIPKASVKIRSIIAKCVVCKRYRAKLMTQKMADLPEQRLIIGEPPFSQSGVDYFGPFEIKRGRSTVKRYGVLFTCFSIRAVHIEVAHSLNTDSCINAIRRFAARRGPVRKLRSDNGTNLIGAKRELREEIEKWNQSRMHSSLRQEDIEWEFNPPYASHHGGVWERMIRSVRKILYGLLREQNTRLDDEGLQTLMCEVEAVINSRPITRVSNDTTDPQALTPNHLLLLQSGQVPPPGVFQKEDNLARRRWRQIQHLANVFWRRWSKEYLTRLQERQKWVNPERNIEKNDIVLVADNSPRNQWQMGRVVDVFPDEKGLVRIARVKMGTSVLERPITKLCVILEADI